MGSHSLERPKSRTASKGRALYASRKPEDGKERSGRGTQRAVKRSWRTTPETRRRRAEVEGSKDPGVPAKIHSPKNTLPALPPGMRRADERESVEPVLSESEDKRQGS